MKNLFRLQFLLILFFAFVSGDLFAQLKLDEGFEGTTFPPTGWSSVSVVAGSGTWARSTTNPKFGIADASSAFTTLGANNYLISKRFVPASGDSLVFWLAQTFTALYADTMNVRISTTDSLVSSMTTILLHLTDTQYPLPAGTYARYAVSLNAYAGSTCWLGWQHYDLDGETIRLDGITVGIAPANNITIANVSPVDSTNTDDTYAPKASFTNSGSINQFNFTVNYQIGGPLSPLAYNSTKNIDTLLVGQTKTITFDSSFTPTDTGKYSANITSSVGDSPPLGFIFLIISKNWGLQLTGPCSYYWANSQAVWSFTRPTFSWKNPVNPFEVILVNKGVVGVPLAPATTLDDGYWNLNNILTGKKIKFCGTLYSSIFPATNGNIGLVSGTTAFTVNYGTGPFPGILPLFMDLDFRDTTSINPNRLSYTLTPNELVITYLRVRRYTALADPNDYVSFQVCIELVDPNNANAPNSSIRFNYYRPQTSTTFLNNSTGGGPINTITNQLVGLRPPGSPAINYRVRNPPALGAGFKTGPIFGGVVDKSTNLSVEFGQVFRPLNILNSFMVCFRVYFEGYRLANINPIDTVTISARDAVSPHPILQTVKGLTTSIFPYGYIWLVFDYIYTKGFYYFTVQQKSTIRTWTQLLSGPVGDTLVYDLTTGVNKAYGSNEVLVSGGACMYSGDVNQNGVIDVADVSLVDNDVFNFVIGYVPTDVNGNGFVDANDLGITDNNAYNFVFEVSPPGPIAPPENMEVIPFVSQQDPSAKAREDAYAIEKIQLLKNEELSKTSNVKIR